MNDLNVILSFPNGRSGSIFFHSLFDMHPEVVSFPVTFDWYMLDVDLSLEAQDVIEIFLNQTKNPLSTKDITSDIVKQQSFSYFEENISKKDFVNNFLEISPKKFSSRKQFFELSHVALAKTLGYDLSKLKYIFVHAHCFGFIKEKMNFLFDEYPNLYMFALTRDIRETWVSMKQYSSFYYRTNNNRILLYDLLRIESAFSNVIWQYFYEIIEKTKHDKIVIIDNIQLHKFGEKAMKYLAKKLDISFDESLCKSTFLGKQWSGNLSSGEQLSTFNKNKKNTNWQKKLKFQDKLFVKIFCENILKTFGYKSEKVYFYERVLFGIYFLFYLLPLEYIKPSLKDLKILENIKTSDDIMNPFFKKLNISFAKKVIYIYILIEILLIINLSIILKNGKFYMILIKNLKIKT